MAHEHRHGHGAGSGTAGEAAGRTIDPVCGMEADPQSLYWATYNGKTYRFCSDHCEAFFKRNPEQYLHAATA